MASTFISQFDAVLFDLDDTLHDDTATFRLAALEVAKELAREHPLDAESLAAAYGAEADAFWHKLSNETIGTSLGKVRESMWASALEGFGIVDPGIAERCAAAYNQARRNHLRVWPRVPELLERLRAGGSKLGLVTNGFAETHREKIALLELDESFDEIFIADEVGMVKPDPRLFRHACERLGATSGRSLMVGDRYDRDIRGAQAAGLAAVWLNIRGESLPDGAEDPLAVVSSIGELERLFFAEGWNHSRSASRT